VSARDIFSKGKTPDRRGFGRFGRVCSLIVQTPCETFRLTQRYLLQTVPHEGNAMKKTLIALAAVATLALSSLAPAPAHAQRGLGAGIAAGVIGGALLGGAIANGPAYGYGPRYGYGPGYGYYGGPAYVAGPGPGYYDNCFWQRQRFWDGYGWRIRRVRVCG
jgi:hypothetical protein